MPPYLKGVVAATGIWSFAAAAGSHNIMQQKSRHPDEKKVLCVDLDGTLIRTDLLIESVIALIRCNVLYIFMIPYWLWQGKGQLKMQVASRVEIHPELLPYSKNFLEFLRAEKAGGRKLVLVTASNEAYAQAVADHLGLFDEVMASDAFSNLRGSTKLAQMDAAFGKRSYDYAGNSHADLAIFGSGAGIILVNPVRGLRDKAQALGPVSHEFNEQPLRWEAYLKAMRPHQWLKNALVFVPLLLAQKMELLAFWHASLAFIAFAFCASSVYILNDLFDLNDDRRHAVKKNRPFAAGAVPIQHGIVLKIVLLSAGFAIALLLPWQFVAVLGAYYATTLSYSLFFKRTMLFDVIALAGLYTLRIVAGSAALGIPGSSWLLAFSVFLFFSLALVKRYVELSELMEESEHPAPLATRARGYRRADREALSQFGITSGLIAVLVLALYIDTTVVKTLYARPEMLWLVCPIMLYLVCRIWILARRGDLVDDPVLFVVTDWRSLFVLAVGGLIVLLAAV